jgi:hypothetical protein
MASRWPRDGRARRLDLPFRHITIRQAKEYMQACGLAMRMDGYHPAPDALVAG